MKIREQKEKRMRDITGIIGENIDKSLYENIESE